MQFQVHPYIFPASISALVNVFVGVMVWRRASSPGRRPLALILFAAAVWGAACALMWASPNLSVQILSLNCSYLGALIIPAAFLVFVLEHTGNATRPTFRRMAWLLVEPALTLVALWINPFNLFYGTLRMEQQSSFTVLYWEGGILFWVNIVYSYLLLSIAFILLIRMVLRSRGRSQTRARILLLGALMPLLANVFSLPDYSLIYELDLTPIAISGIALFFTVALFRLRLFDFSPLARGLVVEKISDGMVVLDQQNLVVDINTAAREMIGLKQAPIGRRDFDIFSNWIGPLAAFRDENRAHAEIKIQDIPPRYLELQIDPLEDEQNRFMGRVIILRDITARKQSEEELKYAHGNLQKQYAEALESESQFREQAIRDSLTGVFNRRYMEEALIKEFSKASLGNYPVSVVALDLDHLKAVNDTYGHEAGDRVLVTLAKQLLEETRKSDIVLRYGGDEFVVVMPSASQNQAMQRVEKWRVRFGGTRISYPGAVIKSTFSAGVVSYPKDGESAQSIFNAADRALYIAKESGRNRIKAPVYDPSFPNQ